MAPLALREAREAASMTLADVVREVTGRGYALSTTTLHNWEAGKTQPPVGFDRILADVIGCSLKSIRNPAKLE